MLMLPILMYHRVAEVPHGAPDPDNYVRPKQFDEQLAWLSSRGYTTITIEDWLNIRAGRLKPPPRPIALTFDDGYQSQYDIAWPLLRRYGATATIFLVADFIGKNYRWDGHKAPEPHMGKQEILEMQAGGICFGTHTCTHRLLVELSANDVLSEFTRSRAELEELLGRRVRTVAYPYNKQNASVRALARKAGYEGAVLGRGRMNTRWTNPWTLRRMSMNLRTTQEAFRHQLTRSPWLSLVSTPRRPRRAPRAGPGDLDLGYSD